MEPITCQDCGMIIAWKDGIYRHLYVPMNDRDHVAKPKA